MILTAVVVYQAVGVAVFGFLGVGPTPPVALQFVAGLVATVVAVAGYVAYVHWVESRGVSEFGRRGAVREFALGTVLGAALFSTAIAIVWAAGGYTITETNSWQLVVPLITGALFFATLEELVYRGVVLRLVELPFGTWAGLAVSALAFAAFHVVATPNVTLWTGLSVFLAGLLLGGAYVYTRRLWFPIALHAAWNFVQGGVFGIAVSGDEAGLGLFVGTTSGPTWLSGGDYGLEGSAVVVGVVLLATMVVLRQARQRGHFRAPARRS
ncbi:hypothetical protein SAMN04487950_0130 [Halogranum rubrum]|uniref:CAAX prenyl protease 2/Lysostaphin resistance protein A-like domain-containing protein n=2 Tax=Halogranum rubrum TaxID=553466 RepID=A0A1I4AW21_9EURY|nr:hypothetical protein SAMN04487950_0130 [Halogranum rubrum]